MTLVACGGDDDETCDPVANTGCEDGNVCEQVVDGEPQCFAPVEVRGRVLDLGDNGGIAGARVTAVDVNSAAASSVALSSADGTYSLRVPAVRSADGTPAAFPVTLRADASGYQSFPGPIRQALPLDVASAVDVDGTLVVQSTITDIGLLAHPAGTGTGSIHGTVDVPDDHAGILVVAETATAAGVKGFAAIAANDGDYQIFNLEAGTYSVTAYSLGHVYEIGEVTVNNATAELNLALTDQAAGTINGTVSIVDGGGASATSVIAFVESTFDPLTGRGTAIPGLRAPQTGAPNISGAFTLDAVPPGNYVVVAAFENDGLVRDPDRCIAGTEDVHLTVTAGGVTEAPTTFKITGALSTMSPGATAAEPITTGVPTFTWGDDSSEDAYLVELFDAFGQLVYSKTLPGVSGGTPSLTYDGTEPLVAGMYYQWRVTSSRSTTGEACNISRTEDLRGVFFIP